jgi:hypothetical protein
MRHSLIILALLSGSIAVRGAAAAGPGATEVEERLAKDIPADFDSFVKRFENPVRRPTLILIPDGRSLAKKKAGFSDPRILPLLSNGFGGPADTFMAFTPRNHQMEMISWRDPSRFTAKKSPGGRRGRPRPLGPPRRGEGKLAVRQPLVIQDSV